MTDPQKTKAEQDFGGLPKPGKKLALPKWVSAWLTDQGRSVELYARAITGSDFEWIEEKKRGLQSREIRFTVLRCVLDSDGKRYFATVQDESLIAGWPQDVLTDLYLQIIAGVETFDVTLGKSAATPS